MKTVNVFLTVEMPDDYSEGQFDKKVANLVSELGGEVIEVMHIATKKQNDNVSTGKKAKFSPEIISTYEKEREERKAGKIIPEARFGLDTSKNIYLMAKNNKDMFFEVKGIDTNVKLGPDYDMVYLTISNIDYGVRRKWLVFEQ